jgi:DNA-binding NarL/FixJ family response regulator
LESPLRQQGARIRTLLVDDSPVALELLASFLSSMPEIEVIGTAKDGEQARSQAEFTRPDLVLADLEMPRVSGLELTIALRQKFPSMRLVIISTHEGPVWEQLSHEHGADAFVPKRAIVTALPGLVERLFAGAALPVIPGPVCPDASKLPRAS